MSIAMTGKSSTSCTMRSTSARRFACHTSTIREGGRAARDAEEEEVDSRAMDTSANERTPRPTTAELDTDASGEGAEAGCEEEGKGTADGAKAEEEGEEEEAVEAAVPEAVAGVVELW